MAQCPTMNLAPPDEMTVPAIYAGMTRKDERMS